MRRNGWFCGGVTVARNKVQFQKGLSEAEFERLYGTEEQCRDGGVALALAGWLRLPGVRRDRSTSVVKTRALYQCTACRRQTSLIAGTIFASTKVPLRLWFRAMYHLTQSKQGISSIELGPPPRRRPRPPPGRSSTSSSRSMMERDATKRLTGRVEIDDAYLGGERTGGKRGRGAPGKTPFVAAVETTPEGKPVRLKLRRVASFLRRADRRPSPSAASIRPAPSSATACSCFGASPTPAASTSRSSPARARRRLAPGLQVGQHRARQHQGRHRRHLPRHPQQACAALPRRVRIPLQPPIRSRRHDPAPGMGRRCRPRRCHTGSSNWLRFMRNQNVRWSPEWSQSCRARETAAYGASLDQSS